jgi:hypothetical protein
MTTKEKRKPALSLPNPAGKHGASVSLLSAQLQRGRSWIGASEDAAVGQKQRREEADEAHELNLTVPWAVGVAAYLG